MKRPEMKHSYVISSSYTSPSILSPLGSPTSQTPLSRPSAAIVTTTTTTSTTKKVPAKGGREAPVPQPTKPKRTRSRLQKTPSTKPLLRPNIQQTQPEPYPIPAHAYLPPPSPPAIPPSPRRSPYRSIHHLSTLSLTGRPPSRFRFWTTITADGAPPRDSWLESQRRKSKQRTWICWSFWIVIILLVTAVVVTILVLRSHGII